MSIVLCNSSIWTCRISNFKYLFWFFLTALACSKKPKDISTTKHHHVSTFSVKSIKKGKIIDANFFLSDVRRSASRSHLDSRVHICLRAMGFKIAGDRKEKRTPSWESTRLFLKSRRAEVEGAVNSYARVRRWVLWPMLSSLCPILLQKNIKKR